MNNRIGRWLAVIVLLLALGIALELIGLIEQVAR
jgi:hypothetical protein